MDIIKRVRPLDRRLRPIDGSLRAELESGMARTGGQPAFSSFFAPLFGSLLVCANGCLIAISLLLYVYYTEASREEARIVSRAKKFRCFSLVRPVCFRGGGKIH